MLLDLPYQRGVDVLKATAHVAERLAAEMHPRPEPGQRDLLGIGAELAGELWPPHKVVDAPPHHAANPGGRRAALQALMLPLQLQVGNGGAQPQAI